MTRGALLACLISLSILTPVLAQERGLPEGVKNTKNPKFAPPAPEEAASRFRVPDGFRVTLFAGEPNVMQPIALAFDDRGRLWVAECYSYPDWKPNAFPGPKCEGKDRILILEDSDGDGRFDNRTVFVDRLANLTGLEIGNGGVYALCAPYLLHFPTRKGQDRPDGPPTIVLDGFSIQTKHNIVNGLIWGPDGWLWGCHGIVADSKPGKPGVDESKRPVMNCGIWRYNTKDQRFDVVCHGTTNPWGLDFDEHGEAFFTNCVIGHLWHAIPGAHYKRMYGQDFNPYTYELIDATSEHLHWGGGDWTSSRGGKGTHDDAGGGHAHSGAMVYLGTNWPAEYRNSIFMCNIHGLRLNRDLLQRQGNGYVGKRAPDIFRTDSEWFRGVAVKQGPEGAVYVADWSDLGECHDHDGSHRSTGRIYCIAHGKTASTKDLDLSRKSNAELVALQLDKNEWLVRHARRLLAERGPSEGTSHSLHGLFGKEADPTRRLRLMWALHGIGGDQPDWLVACLQDPDEHVRAWALRFFLDNVVNSEAIRDRLFRMAENDPSGLVRLHLASALQRTQSSPMFWPLATRLARHAEDAGDRCQPLLLWYGIEPKVPQDRRQALELLNGVRIPKLRQFIVRRLAETADNDKAGLDPVIQSLGATSDDVARLDMLTGLRDGLKGQKRVELPASWPAVQDKLAASSKAEVREAVPFLSLLFDAPGAVAAVRKTLDDSSAGPALRSAALAALVERRVPDLGPRLLDLVQDPVLRGPAIRALAAYPQDTAPESLLKAYPSLSLQEKQDVIASLSSRPKYALALLVALEEGRIPRSDVNAFTARQLQDLGHKEVSAKVQSVWGQLRQSSQERKARIAQLQGQLTPQALDQGDAKNGQAVFQRACQQCHTLHGAGGKVGPDLTGSNRKDLYYVLENVIDPSAFISRDYQLVNFLTKDDRLIGGIILEETAKAVTIQTATDKVVLAKEDIAQRKVAPVSMMPEGLVEQMTKDEFRDLVSYLRK